MVKHKARNISKISASIHICSKSGRPLWRHKVTKLHIYLALSKSIGKVTHGRILMEVCNHMVKCKSF